MTTGGDQSQQTSRAEEPVMGRDRLARLVVVGSFLALFLLTGTLLALAQNKEGSDTAGRVFNAILPVLAGWVGTVLAFYFSSANQERTNAILDKTIDRVSTARAPTASGQVAEKMIPLAKIERVRDMEKRPPAQVPLAELQADFAAKLPNGAAVTRLISSRGESSSSCCTRPR